MEKGNEKFNEFMNGVKNLGVKHYGEATTKDGSKWEGDQFTCMILILSHVSIEMLEAVGQLELMQKMAAKFIEANTNKDLMAFVRHHLMKSLADHVIDSIIE